MESRKIQLVGNRSYAISLPKEWIKANKLKQKDSVIIESTKGNDLLLSLSRKKQYKEIEVNIQDIDNITEFIMFCYVKNVDKLILLSKEFNHEQQYKIRHIINFLEGYNIVSEEKNRIEIAFLFKDIQITIDSIHKRMIHILKTMLYAIDSKDKKGIDEIETDMDKLYHLAKRIIIACINNAQLQKENNIDGLEELFFLKDVSKRLEKIGDSLHELSKYNIKSKQKEKITLLLDIVYNMLSNKKNLSELNTKLNNFKNEDSSKAGLIINKIHDRIKDMFENISYIEYNKKYFSE